MLFFQMLEMLARPDTMAARHIMREAWVNGEGVSVVRAMILRGAQHDTEHDVHHRMDAMILATEWARCYASASGLDDSEATFFLHHLIEYLSEIRVRDLDSNLLKSSTRSRAVAVHDLDEALTAGRCDDAMRRVGELMAVMDNPRYFLEVLAGAALRQSIASVLVVQSLMEAVKQMGWDNHFTPFPIMHTVLALCRDGRTAAAEPGEPRFDMFDSAGRHVTNLAGLFRLAALLRLRENTPILSSRLERLYAGQLASESPSELSEAAGFPGRDRWINMLIFKSSMQTLSQFSIRTGWVMEL